MDSKSFVLILCASCVICSVVGPALSTETVVDALVLDRLIASNGDGSKIAVDLRMGTSAMYRSRCPETGQVFSASEFGPPGAERIVVKGATARIGNVSPSSFGIQQVTCEITEGEFLVNNELELASGEWDGKKENAIHRLNGKVNILEYEFLSDEKDPLIFRMSTAGYTYVAGSGTVRDARTGTAFVLTGKGSGASQRQIFPVGDIAKGIHIVARAGEGHVKIVRGLLDDGVNPNTSDYLGESALMRAASNGHKDVVELLIGRGANPNLENHEGFRAIMGAALKGHSEIVNILLEHGADVNARETKFGLTPLMIAVSNGYPLVVEALLAKGADTQTKNQQGDSSVDLAKKKGNREIITMITKYQEKR